MNSLAAFFSAISLSLLGISRIINIKKSTKALSEAVRFIDLIKNNIRYSSMNYYDLVETGKKENFKFISFLNEITLLPPAPEKAKKEFSDFTKKIGTTDDLGQISICEEYQQRFRLFYNESLAKEKGRISVSGVMSLISVMAILVL